MKKIKALVSVQLIIVTYLSLQGALAADSTPVLNFTNKFAIKFEKVLKIGEVELLEFLQPVSLAHYGTSRKSLDYIDLEKLDPSKDGYKKFMIKAKEAGSGELTFESGTDVIKVKVIVQENYEQLEIELNTLFGIKNASSEERIQVISANTVSDINDNKETHIYLRGKVETTKNALLAVAFAANAVGDKGVKIFSNPGGQLRMKDLESSASSVNTQVSINAGDDSSFAEFYESTNRLIDTNNLYRDLVLSSGNEKVISYIQVAEPKRYAVKVRFLEMDARYVDDFVSSLSATTTAGDIKGGVGSPDLFVPSINRSGTGFNSSRITDEIGTQGIARLTSNLVGGNLASGTIKILDNAFLNINVNDLLSEGVLRVVNEFSLVTHSGEMVSLGKGTRFPIPRINNGVGNSSVSVEYIPIGFKGELKVTGLENNLIDVQLASRLSSAESSTVINGVPVPVFNEEVTTQVSSRAKRGDPVN
jgi:Flp pilus assembly secretin CpaC